jgi:hypothetical protein
VAEDSVQDRLRNWAGRTPHARAAVELLIAGVGGRLAYKGAPWVEELGRDEAGRGYAEIDPAALVRESGPLSSGERFIAKVVANLLDDSTPVALADISRLDTSQARLALGALRVAAGLPPTKTSPPTAPSRVVAPAPLGPSGPQMPPGWSARRGPDHPGGGITL